MAKMTHFWLKMIIRMTITKMAKNDQKMIKIYILSPQAKALPLPAAVLEKIIFLTSKLKQENLTCSSFTLYKTFKKVQGKARRVLIFLK